MGLERRTIRLAVLEEAFSILTAEGQLYEELRKYLESVFTLPVEIEPHSSTDFNEIDVFDQVPWGADILVLDTQLSVFENFSQANKTIPSFVWDFSSSIIFTAEPEEISKACDNIFNIDLEVVLVFVVSNVAVASLSTLILSLLRDKKKIAHLENFFGNLWETFFYFCLQAGKTLPPVWSRRILLIVWLVSVRFLSISLSCAMNSEFSFVTYDFIDSLKDVISHPEIIPRIPTPSFEKIIFKARAPIRPEYQKVQKKIDKNEKSDKGYLEVAELFDPSFYSFPKEEVFIFNYLFLECVAGEIMKDSYQENRKIYISKPVIQEYMMLPLGSDFASNKSFVDLINKAFMNIFETKWLTPLRKKPRWVIEGMSWTPKWKVFDNIKFKGILSVFSMYIRLTILSLILLVIEVVANLIYQKHSAKNRFIILKKKMDTVNGHSKRRKLVKMRKHVKQDHKSIASYNLPKSMKQFKDTLPFRIDGM